MAKRLIYKLKLQYYGLSRLSASDIGNALGLFTVMRSMTIILCNKTCQGYVPRNILKLAGYFFLASGNCSQRAGGRLK